MAIIYPIIVLLGLMLSIISVIKRAPLFNFIGIQIALYGGLKSVELIIPPLP